MEPRTRKKLFFGIAVFLMLALIAIGMILTFAQGLDRRKIFVDLPAYWAVFPFALAFPVYIGLEYFLSGKFQEEGFLLGYRSKGHDKVVSVTFFVAVLSLLAGATLAFALVSSINVIWACFIESLISVVPMAFYLLFTLIKNLKENATISHCVPVGCFLGALLALETATLTLSLEVSVGFLLFYASLPLLCLVMMAISPEISPEPETLE